MGSHEVNANVEFGANAIFSFRQFTSNALTPRGGSAKSKRETFLHNATFVQVVKGQEASSKGEGFSFGIARVVPGARILIGYKLQPFVPQSLRNKSGNGTENTRSR